MLFFSPLETIAHKYLQSWATLLSQGVLTHGSAGCLLALKSHVFLGSSLPQPGNAKLRQIGFSGGKLSRGELKHLA